MRGRLIMAEDSNDSNERKCLIEKLKLKQEKRLKNLRSSCETLNIRPRNYSTLPSPILHNIFKYLDRNYVTQHLSLVCRHWRRSIKHEEIIKHLFVRRNETQLHYIFDHLRRYKSLTGLHLDNVPNPKPILIQTQKFARNLTSLALTNYRYFDGKLLEYAVRAFPLLEDLNLESSTIDYKTDISILISQISNLKSFNLSDVKIQFISVQTILQIALNCRLLEKLNVGLLPPMVQLIDDDACLIIANTSHRLKFLAIDSRSLTNRTFERLKECETLTALYIKYAINFNGDFLREFWTDLAPNIEEMGFTHNCIITGKDVESLFSLQGEGFGKLTHLDFTYCPLLTDEGIEAIAKRCSHLEYVRIKSCRSITNIENLGKRCQEIRHLNVAFCVKLKAPLLLPKILSTLIIDEKSKLRQYANKYSMQYCTLKVFVALSEFTDDMHKL